MRLLAFIFKVLLCSLLCMCMVVVLAIMFYFLKTILDEIFERDGVVKGIERSKEWIRSTGETAQKKRENW